MHRRMSAEGVQPAEIVGRDAELEAIGRWLGGERPALLEIEGEAGIGKTTLLEEAIRAARASGALDLSCRPLEIETAVSYGGLASLLEEAVAIAGDEVPKPRLRALEGALRLRDVSGSRLDETAVALGVQSLLRAAARRQSVALAVEDVQWLDASSRVALTYALRNLQAGDDVCVVLACRVGAGAGSLDLKGSALTARAERLTLGPLSLGAMHRMIHARLGTALSRPKLVRVHSTSGGNPLYALELARVVADADPNEAALTLPASLAAALDARIDALSAPTRRLLLAASAASDPRPELLAGAIDPDSIDSALDEAVRHGVLVLVDGQVRFTHPLLASTVYTSASELDRGRTHKRLGEIARTPEERARHLALGGTGPDAAVAAALERAAESACQRGARGTGAALYEQAASLSPTGEEPARARRLVAAADAHFHAGEPERARTLLEEVAIGDSPSRFEALWQLGTLLDETVGGDAALAPLEEALGTDDPVLAARIHRSLAQALSYVGDLERALVHADAAVGRAEPLLDPANLAYALSIQALVRKMSGHPAWREPLERALGIEEEVELSELDLCPSAVEADTRRLALQLDEARGAYERMLARAMEGGDVRTEAWCLFGLAAVEILCGRWSRASEHAEELSDLAEQTALLRLPALRTAAHVALLRGDSERARTLLSAVVAEAEPAGELLNLRVALQLKGFLELSVGEPGAAIPALRRAREIAEQMRLGEASMLLFQLDEVEALTGAGDAEAAAAVLRGFEERTAGDPSPWLPPLVLRARGLVQAAEGDLTGARASFEAAVTGEGTIPLPLERARTRLALGRVLRRTQHRTAAQTLLGEALASFEELGAPLWAEQTRLELGRVGGRPSSGADLTPTEQRIAELVAEGKTNREVGALLFVTPRTVESALTRVYRKLGVRSRTELARRLSEAG
jgi:DNA-binding CsgD family transcriptional regulator